MIGILQAQDAKQARAFFWSEKDEFKKVTAIPEKWKNESAVIIHKHELYDYHKFGKNVTYISGIRKRILLLDQAAITEFSQFNYKNKFYSNKAYRWKKGSNFIGVKIIKPDGKEIEIDTEKEAKEVDEEKKLAIPNLEIGDIIDYYYYSVEPFKSLFDYTFDAIEMPLGDVYPTMDLKITLNSENDFFINFNTYNGAPELKEIPMKSSGERSYELQEKDIPKNEFPRWFYPLAEMPCFKFQVIFARSGKFEKLADGFLSEKERDIKKTVSKEDVFDYYNKKFVPLGDLGDINDFLKGRSFKSEEEKIIEVYYFTRHQFFTRYIEAFVVNDAKLFYPFEYYGYSPIFFNTEGQFVNYFMQFLRKNEISFDIIIAKPRYDGSIDDLLIQQNLKKLLRVNTKTPIYLEYFSPFSSADQFDYNIENSKAYVLEVSKGKRVTDASSVQLPSSSYQENNVKTKTEMTLDAFTGFKTTKTSSYYGHLKDGEQSERLNFYDYVYEDYRKYATKPLLDYVKNKKKNEQYANELTALINKMKDLQKESSEKSIEGELDFSVDDYTIKILNTGRYGKNSPFEIKEEFMIKDNLLKKAGNNYLIEIGKMLTSQVEIDQKEKDRKNNVYSVYPRSYENEIVLNIPAGYIVSGLEKLTKKVENETGGFTSTAEIKGNQLIVKTLKYYKNYFETNANWPKMIAFLDTAYQFTQEKVLLKKN